MRSKHHCTALVIGAAVASAQPAGAGTGDLIATGYMGPNEFGALEPIDDIFSFRFGAGPATVDPFDFDGPWLFDLHNIDSSYQGHTWIATTADANFAAFETVMTDGLPGYVAVQHRLDPDDEGFTGITWGLGSLFFDAIENGTPPFDEPGRTDLHGYYLTEVHMTFEELLFGEREILPGLTAYGYRYTLRVDFYGNLIPAPSSLAIFAAAPLLARRRRRD